MHGAERFTVDTSAFAKGWTIEACLLHLNACGFHHFEVTPAPGFLWPGDMDAAGCAHFRRFLAGHRLRIVALTVPEGARSADAFIDLGGQIGAQGTIVDAGAPGASPAGFAIQALDGLVRRAEKAGTALWLGVAANSPRRQVHELMQLIASQGNARIGVAVGLTGRHVDQEHLAMVLRTVAARLKFLRVASGSDGSQSDLNLLPPLLAEIGYADWPAIKLSGGDLDKALAGGVTRLLAAGFGAVPGAASR
jgi:hypothetical protein